MVQIDINKLKPYESEFEKFARDRFEAICNSVKGYLTYNQTAFLLRIDSELKDIITLINLDTFTNTPAQTLFHEYEIANGDTWPNIVIAPFGKGKNIVNFKALIQYIFDYDTLRNKDFVKTAYSNLGLHTCPYCNIQTISIQNHRFQLDHIIDKSTYPYLAISMYNLIPSCHGCNHAKSKSSFYYSPYLTSLSDKFEFVNTTFNFAFFNGSIGKGIKTKWIKKIKPHALNHVKEIDTFFNTLGILEILPYFDYEIEELLYRIEIYGQIDVKKEKIYKDFFKQDEKVFFYAFVGSVSTESEILSRPLGKAKYDIIKHYITSKNNPNLQSFLY